MIKPQTDRELEIFLSGYERGLKAGEARMFEKILYFLEKEIKEIEAEIQGEEGD